ncbi:MAG: nicotinate-nicotinamide nucleotide adenylyltransferase [Anaerovoracaceae bacterium]|jgi:nicotinic acid mononucleotide adenylyltransferase
MAEADKIRECVEKSLLERGYLATAGMKKAEAKRLLSGIDMASMSGDLAAAVTADNRIHTTDILDIAENYFTMLEDRPPEGWLMHCYRYILNSLYPHLEGPEEPEKYANGRTLLLQLMRGVFKYEREAFPFDPTRDLLLLEGDELEGSDCAGEYEKMRRAVRSHYVYEFMRIGTDITPFNTLGHISGVHYVAVYMAEQLKRAGVPVDLGLISAAAAAHDIGKYGCRKEEEKRVPYLHYYYTDYCLNMFGLPQIAHIAAKHSVWDLELNNLSAESLLLIYADFRVKSTRDENGTEIIHFSSLATAFDVILNKLDNVDDAKRHRYVKVYNKLKDFEDYMIELGADPELPNPPAPYREDEVIPVKRETALLHGADVVSQMKFRAVEHNIRIMSSFNRPGEFAGLIDAARSEMRWENLRTYLNIFDEYSTYMTGEQKTMTLRFLYEQLMHHESDIRSSAAGIMGRIVARYREEYKKELPKSVPAPDITGTNLYMFEKYIGKILEPGHKHTAQHRAWITDAAPEFIRNVVTHCRESCRHRYFELLEPYYLDEKCGEHLAVVLADTVLGIDKEYIPDAFYGVLRKFVDNVYGKFGSTDLIIMRLDEEYLGGSAGAHEVRRRSLMGTGSGDTEEILSSMFLDDLKTNTSWIVKTANIRYMLDLPDEGGRGGRMLHTATHFTNLIKVSETVTVRKAAGSALLELIGRMPLDQRNELTIELFNGLEIGDYQFSKYIPEFLGVMILYLPPNEIDEFIDELVRLVNAGNFGSAAAALETLAVTLEHYDIYAGHFREPEEDRKRRECRLCGMLMKGFAYYDSYISREAFHTVGERIFESGYLGLEEKWRVAKILLKKILTILPDGAEEETLTFYNNAAVLNHIYGVLSEYQTEIGDFGEAEEKKVAFFPGTFDPFSLGHKAIATTIRDFGFEVYLAIDEFSWSKKAQPHMLRKQIAAMSVADEQDIYLFPDDIPINIANPDDMKRLREEFGRRDVYIAVGSDVVMHASGYRTEPTEDSIHTFNHIIFARESRRKDGSAREQSYPITGDIIELTLKKYYEDISSTRIRENIDLRRDISNLIDPVAQNFIYDNDLYTREPAYKHELQARDMKISPFGADADSIRLIADELGKRGYDTRGLFTYLENPKTNIVYIESGRAKNDVVAFAAAHKRETHELLEEFGSADIAAHIRRKAAGEIAVIGAFYSGNERTITNLSQIMLTEILTALLARDVAYVVYHPVDPAGMAKGTVDVLRRHGFVNISDDHTDPIYAVDMKAPVIVFRDVETVIKAPLNKNQRVLKTMDDAHYKLLHTFTEIFPGQLILSFNPNAVYSKIIDLVTAANGVSTIPDPRRIRGPYMCVPFGKALSDVVVPNTVTKTLRTEKYFAGNLRGFEIRETRDYLNIEDQVRTIGSFGRPVILVDDLLHKGHRMDKIDPLFRKQCIDVRKVIVGVLTGNARDRMQMKGREVEDAYFIPTINIWLNERDCYPFIGGDGIDSEDEESRSSINLIMPYTSFNFVGNDDRENTFKYSMTCLENAYDILRVLEEEYQARFEKKLTLKRLGEVITYPRRPSVGTGLGYDESMAPSAYVESDMKRLKRLNLVKEKKR